jgi:hypothetical protein
LQNKSNKRAVAFATAFFIWKIYRILPRMAESLYKCAGIPPLPGVEKKQKRTLFMSKRRV